ncbi:MAG: PAS domain S-box protein, partial [Mucilaginibacter sp.]
INNQYRIVRKDYTIRWVENKIIPTLDETGALIRVDGVTRDVTAKKEAEEKHKENKEHYRRIVETSQEGIWTIDENNKTNFVNKKICEILGYTSEEMLGRELYDFMDEAGKEYAIACMERRRNGAKESLDVRYVTKSGADVWANISANPIFDEQGVYKGALAMVTDITKRRLDEEVLKKSEANLRTIFNNTDTAYILFSVELKIVSFNTLAQKYSEEQNHKKLKANHCIKDYFSAERWPAIQDILEKLRKGKTVNYELKIVKDDGSVRWHDVRWLNVKTSANKHSGFILANKDITEAKVAELERERITADLIQHNKDLEQFTYIISHNLRAPVANIIGLSDMLKEDDLDHDIKQQLVDKVSLSIKNIDVIIKDLNHILTTRNLLNEKKEMVDFNELLNEIKASITNNMVNDNVQFHSNFNNAESLFTIRSYIYSILYNLSSNSVKYRQPGISPVVTISAKKIADKIELVFKDNGKGIDMVKNGTHLFGLYKRFDATTEGKGMGLFMV